MKPFDLERALKGDPVITRQGYIAEKIVYIDDKDLRRPLVFRPKYPGALLLTYPRSGLYDETEISDYDLFMAPKK